MFSKKQQLFSSIQEEKVHRKIKPLFIYLFIYSFIFYNETPYGQYCFVLKW